MSLKFFYGDEEYLMEQEINKLKTKLLDKEFLSMNFKSVKNQTFPDFISLLSTQPMMFGKQLIVIDVENFFAEALEDNQAKELEDAMKNISESLYIILTLTFERNSKRKPDSRRKFYKLLQKYAELQEFASTPTYKTDDLISFINKEAKKQNLTFERPAAERLIEQIGNNLRELVKEIEKLSLVAYPKNKVTEQMVKDNCIINEDIFALSDKLFNGKKASAVYEFRKMCDKQEPIVTLATLQTNLRKAIIMKMYEKNLSDFEIAKIIGGNTSDYWVKKNLEKLKDANLKELVGLKRRLTDVEYRLKSGQILDIEYEIETAFY